MQLQNLAKQGSFAGELALAAFYNQQGDYVLAQTQLNQLKKQNKLHNLLTLIQTDVYLGQNKLDDAYQTIASSARIMPENRALAYKLAEVLIRQKQPAQANNLVQNFVNQNPRDIAGWNLLQQSANIDVASPLRAVNVLRYRAEVEYWSGLEEGAIKSLLHAQRLAKDNVAMSAQLKQRIDQMQKERQLRI